ERLRVEGYNELRASRPRSFIATFVRSLAEPMFLLLLAASAVYMILGDRVEALFLLASVVAVIAITIFQERRTERVLEALRDLSSPRALVVRDGEERRIPGREVVRDDVLVLREGDRIAADAQVLDASDLHVDESLLTGESVAVAKHAAARARHELREGEDRVFAGTLIVKGHGVARASAIGSGTEMGRIGTSLTALGVDATALQMETRRLVRVFSLVALVLCLILAGTYIVTRGEWLTALLAGLTLAMSILPEEFPVVLTVYLALGAWRISKVNVLTRRVVAIEALGAATVLCVDKTGTLTQNRMSVRELSLVDERLDLGGFDIEALPAAFRDAARVAVLASEPKPFDPMERALHALGPCDSTNGTLIKRYPLSAHLLAVTHVWRFDDSLIAASKGAPEAIVALCHLPAKRAARVLTEASQMAARGLRVLGLAKRESIDGALPRDARELAPSFVGLVGLADPLRASVPAAMRECREAGIRVVMVTGDYPVTAMAIARDAGLAQQPVVLTGAELAKLSDAGLRARLPAVDVFARVVPEQKLRIVETLKALGEVVAMTGDGVNDAPALKAAGIGIAMGERGTDVAREAAAIVLLDDDFGSIVKAIRQGRRIFDNLRKAMSYIVAVHIPIAALSLIPVMMGMPPVLYPAHVLFLEFIIDPACSIAFEAEPAEPDTMRRPPRPPRQALIGREQLLLASLEGVLGLVFTIGIYNLAVAARRSDNEVRVLAFTAVVLANLSLIFFARAGGTRLWRHIVARNPALWWIVAGTLAAYAGVLAVPFLREQFRFSAWPADAALIIGPALATLWIALVVLHLTYGAIARRFSIR
ncbi:MAG TPA: cation-translocating P-type ATPase, partial [Casimicrobiaceae bacterium]|nr:cation-translocating P-type ATPase [Casimicrobiaceae bacterium]